MNDVTSLGARLRARRRELGWTQEELAERAGLSADIISRVERGARKSYRWSTIVSMSKAMDIDPGDMVGKGNHISQTGAASVLAVRDAIYDPSLLPGLPSETTGEPATPAELWADVERSYGTYFSGEFGVLASELPAMLAHARATQAAEGRRAAAPSLAHTYQLAACMLVHVGKTDAALAATERAITVAQDDADQWRAATLYGTYAWVLLHAARYDDGIRLATGVADTITPAMNPKADPRQLTAWGGLMMHSAVLAGAAGRRDDADEYLAAARAGGALMQSDRHDYWVSFGPSQVAVQTAHIHTATESPEIALVEGSCPSTTCGPAADPACPAPAERGRFSADAPPGRPGIADHGASQVDRWPRVVPASAVRRLPGGGPAVGPSPRTRGPAQAVHCL